MAADDDLWLDGDDEAEWIYFQLTEGSGCSQLTELMVLTFDASLAGVPFVSEWELEHSIQNDLAFLKEDLQGVW